MHAHSHSDGTRAFAWATLINLAYTLLEAGYGFATNSLALLSDMRPRLRQTTWENKAVMIENKILPYLGDKRLNEISVVNPDCKTETHNNL